MANKKVFTDESLATFVDEIKSYTDNAVSTKANSSHNHEASNITSGTLSSDRLPTVPIAKGGTGATTAAAALTNLGLTATAAELNKMDGVTATTAELNYVDGVTSNIQTQLDGKAASGHTHNYAGSSSAGGAATSANKVNASITFNNSGEGASTGTTFNGSTARTISYNTIGAAASSHNHSASNITSGTLSVSRGGTGNSSGYVRVGQKSGTTIGSNATAEGKDNTASGSYAHAEGNGTTASSPYSHAEGINTTASGNQGSHAEGYGSTASGQAAHAEGLNTVASGHYSHTEGSGTIAAGSSQHVQGTYNIEQAGYIYAHIVGNGTADARSNAHTLDWDGNAWFAGTIKIGGTGQDDTSATEVATKAYVDALIGGIENGTY